MSAVCDYLSCIRVPDDDGSLFTTRCNKLMLSGVDEREYGFLMKVESLVFVFEVNIMQMD